MASFVTTIRRAAGYRRRPEKGDGTVLADRRGLFVLRFPVGVQNARPCGVDVGHQVMGFLIAAIGVVALGEGKIGRGEITRRY